MSHLNKIPDLQSLSLSVEGSTCLWLVANEVHPVLQGSFIDWRLCCAELLGFIFEEYRNWGFLKTCHHATHPAKEMPTFPQLPQYTARTTAMVSPTQDALLGIYPDLPR